MQSKKDVWLYSWDDECFSDDEYESREEAIEAAKEELLKFREFGEGIYDKEFGELVYVGKREDVSLPGIDVEDTLERVQELIDDEFEDYSEDWITRIKDEDRKILDDRLNKVFENWINEFGYKPTWFKVVDVEKIKLNEVANEN
ncbi:hypothetical protein [Clostridioides difficile]|uniref:hypothetical protein n=1 Tax=Clostridioides difficile TaxID=1496 RepID=UPI000C9CD2EA|nr:hypothetical protein [Clostridioides difficile]MBF9867517.1 hypothetical protein [Clostridioides difficile]MBY1216469.1 hypothetical protein [Clostridioides difficile]MBZ1029648.1 hypothetical protein [Clostridioides difficile]MCA0852516.1 hypothetical protein [Clostridioides difficile]MCA0875296.1 hypothetical protein [Clostridioides difficile]